MKKVIVFALLLTSATACCNRLTQMTSAVAEAVPLAIAIPPEEPLTGAYTQFRTPNEAEFALFKQATTDLKGIAYTPESVATQVVAGTNYRFICTARTLTAEPQIYRAEIVIFEPLPFKKEKPSVTRITTVNDAH